MTTSSRLKTPLLFGMLLAAIWSSESQAGATGSFERTIQVDEAITLDVSTGSGSIDIRAGQSGEVQITGEIKIRDSKAFGLFRRSEEDIDELIQRFESDPPVTIDDGRVLVGHVKNKRYGNNVSISYEIVVPADTRVKSDTGSGSQTITDIRGPVTADTGSGRITLTNIGNAVDASTGSGSIVADGVAGAFEAHTGSGSVRLTQTAPGDVVVTTGSGGSELSGVVGALKVRAGSGRVVVDGVQKGEWNLDTGSGSVHVSLPDDAAFELDAETGSGSINIDHPLTVKGRISKRHLRGQVRGGGDLLIVETGSGSIKIE